MASVNEKAIAVIRSAQQPDYESRDVIETIKQTVAKGATDAQLKVFLEVCRSTGLNPFTREVYYVADKGLIMAGRDGYLRIANEHPMFDGMETVVERDEKKIPIKATCTVWRKDRSHPIKCEAYYNEYAKRSPVWDTYKSAMIGKVAEVLALKRSFSINGVVTEEEMGQQPPLNVTAELELAEGIDTGGHPVGTKEAAAAVAQRKIEAAKEAKEPRKITQMKAAIALKEELDKPEQKPEPAKIDPDLEMIWSRMTDIASTCVELAKLKDAMKAEIGEIGERQYYSILSQNGVKHANEFRSQKPARIAARQCFEFLAGLGAEAAPEP